jgi:hypothetical protein
VRIRNLSATGAMIDGCDLTAHPAETPLRIELLDDQLFDGHLRWAKDGRAGVHFAERFSLDRLNGPARPALRMPG